MSSILQAVTSVVDTVSRLGRAVLALGVVSWVAAWWTDWEELAVIAVMCFVALAIAVLFTVGRSDYEIELELQPRRVTVGERAGGEMLIRNVSRRRSLPVRVELTIGEAAAPFRVPTLASDETHDELFSVPTRRRAVIPVGPASTVRGDPLGLMRREHQWATARELFVHPKIARLDRLGSGFLRDLEGQTTQDLSPSDVAFHTLREYVPGDDRRHVHWKTTARIGTMMVRQFVDTRRSFLSVLLVTDATSYASDQEFELAVSMAASIGVRALRDDQTVTMVAGGSTLPTQSAPMLLDASAGIADDVGVGGLDASVAEANRRSADASIVAIAVGSRTPIETVRSAASHLLADARILVFRADLAGAPAFRNAGTTTIINAPTLDDYGALLFRLGVS